MKIFTYAAAIALLTAGTAFAQSSAPNGSTMNNSGTSPSTQSDSMDNSNSMNQSSNMDQSNSTASQRASTTTGSRARRVASSRSSTDAKENEETMRLNRQQLASGGAGMTPDNMNGMSSSVAGNPFNNGSPQQAQGSGPDCTPDNMSCGTARENPAINSSPQHRTYGDQQQ